MSNYMHVVGHATGMQRTSARLANVLGGDAASPTAMVPVSHEKTFKDYLNSIRAAAEPEVKDGVGTVVGAVAGAFLTKKHRYLGAVAGASLGRNVPELVHADNRRDAIYNMGVTGAGVAGSLMLPKHPIVGFFAGWILGNIVRGKI